MFYFVPLGYPWAFAARSRIYIPPSISDSFCMLRCPFPITIMTAFGVIKKQVLRVTILEAEGIRNVAVLKKTDSYVAAELVTTAGKRESRTSVKKVRASERARDQLTN